MPPGISITAGYANDEMDRLIDVAQTSVDPSQRVEAFAGIQQLIFDDIPILPMYERGLTYVVHLDLRDETPCSGP